MVRISPGRQDASILHADLDSFFASVEQRDDPSLRGKPVAVGGGVVLACSYEAKAFGVQGAMGGRRARALCPGLITVPPRMHAYSEASKAVFAVFEDTTPLVEGISIDEAFLDVGGLRRVSGEPPAIAHRLREQVREEVGLPITVGVARTKFLAKVASAVGKPDGLLVVPPDGEDDFLHPLPVQRMWGVGPKTTEKLHQRGIFTIADLASATEGGLRSMLGPHAGHQLHALSHHHDPRRVQTRVRRRSIGGQRAIGWAPKKPGQVEAALAGLVDRVTGRMRDAERVGRTITLRLRFEDFSRITRSHSLHDATARTQPILEVARALLDDARPLIAEHGCTLVGISVSNLDGDDAVQLELPFDKAAEGSLDAALDRVRERFGSGAVKRASLITHGEGVAMPTLEP